MNTTIIAVAIICAALVLIFWIDTTLNSNMRDMDNYCKGYRNGFYGGYDKGYDDGLKDRPKNNKEIAISCSAKMLEAVTNEHNKNTSN